MIELKQGALRGADARLCAVWRRHQEAAAAAPVLWRLGGAGQGAPAAGRHPLAHPGQWKEHRHAAAGQVDEW